VNYINIKIGYFVSFLHGEILMGQHMSSPLGERSIFHGIEVGPWGNVPQRK
jgi:hypothetical protein